MFFGSVMADDVVIDFNNMNMATSYSANEEQGIEASTAGDITEAKNFEVGGVTVTVSPKEEGNRNENRFWKTNNGPQLRCYSGTITIKATFAMKSIVFDAPSKFDLTADKGAISEKTWNGEATEIVFTVAGNTQINKITVSSDGGSVTPGPEPTDAVEATCAQIIAGEEGTVFRVTGTCTEIKNTVYGNWMLKDETGEVYIYGTLDAQGATKNFSSLGIEVGDVITVKGPKKTYNGTVELVDVTVEKIVKGGDTPQPEIQKITVAKALEIINALEPSKVTAEEYEIEGFVISLDEDFNPTYGNYTANIGDTMNDNATLKVFRAKNAAGEKFTEDILNVGSKIVVKGKLQKYVKGEEIIPETNGAVILTIDGVSTGISELKAGSLQHTVVFNLQGQRVVNAQKGLFIINGKKVVRK